MFNKLFEFMYSKSVIMHPSAHKNYFKAGFPR
jgi:hypothetical protein